MLKPVVARYRGKVERVYFQAGAGFANPDAMSFPKPSASSIRSGFRQQHLAGEDRLSAGVADWTTSKRSAAILRQFHLSGRKRSNGSAHPYIPNESQSVLQLDLGQLDSDVDRRGGTGEAPCERISTRSVDAGRRDIGLHLCPGDSSDQVRIGYDDPADKGREQPDDRARVAGLFGGDRGPVASAAWISVFICSRHAGAAKHLLMVVVSPAGTLVPIVSAGIVMLARIAIFK